MSTEQNSQGASLVICDNFNEQKCDPECCHSKPHVPSLVPSLIVYEDWTGKGEYHCDECREVCGWRHDAPTCICVPCEQREAK